MRTLAEVFAPGRRRGSLSLEYSAPAPEDYEGAVGYLFVLLVRAGDAYHVGVMLRGRRPVGASAYGRRLRELYWDRGRWPLRGPLRIDG